MALLRQVRPCSGPGFQVIAPTPFTLSPLCLEAECSALDYALNQISQFNGLDYTNSLTLPVRIILLDKFYSLTVEDSLIVEDTLTAEDSLSVEGWGRPDLVMDRPLVEAFFCSNMILIPDINLMCIPV